LEKKETGVRSLIMVLGGFALLSALWAGLFRLGWKLPAFNVTLPTLHGPLMISGFLGTLISLERAVALESKLAYLVPSLSGIGVLALIAGVSSSFGTILMTLSSAGLVFLLVFIFYRHLALYAIVMVLGASCWLIGNGIWLFGLPFYKVAPWWIGFLVFTIAGERLEISRVLHISRKNKVVFVLVIFVLISGALLATRVFSVGVRFTSVGMIALALWLLRNDIAGRTIHRTGLSRFMAVSLLLGYIWLGMSGILGLLFGGTTAGFYYDAILHSVFVGFVFSMIFAHAFIIFPTLLDLPTFLPFHSSLYAYLMLLHVSLILRITGDLLQWPLGRQWGGLFNVIAILLFLGNIVYLSIKTKVTLTRST
jgi:hypothetical protein